MAEANEETPWSRGQRLAESGCWREALPVLRAAVAAAPREAMRHCLLGRVLRHLGETEAALAALAIAVRLAPDDASVLLQLARAQAQAGGVVAAAKSLRRAVEMAPDLAAAHDALAKTLFDAGRLDEALAALRARVAAGQASALGHDLWLFLLHFHPETTTAVLRDAHAEWNARWAAPLRGKIEPHDNEPAPERRLRIGYVSADWREHPVAHAVLPLLARHDRAQGEIFAYSNAPQADAVTERCRSAVDVWREVARCTDDELAARVRADRIDILVDLSLHTTGHRLLVFARKPAPVQVTWAGHPGSTGLEAIDYRFTDRFLDPPERDDGLYAEKSVRLPDSFWCYDPFEEGPPVAPLPAREAGVVTFGCLNKCAKINAGTVALWARVLRAVPRSRMIVRATNDASRARLAAWFEAEAIDRTRIEFVGWQARPAYLALHGRIDVALDPTPYGGHMTLLDGLWMGVPTIALPGETAVSRAGLSLLANAGLSEWVAATPEDFVRLAVERTEDRAGLAALRAALRPRLRESPLMDAARFARGVEAAYRAMWRTWCVRGDGAPRRVGP